tara:strand:+ start:236 stop:535 length:300 start_codon:yes stop_codon:yes gene_type:complete
MHGGHGPLVFHLLPRAFNSKGKEGVGNEHKTDVKHFHFVVPRLDESQLLASSELSVSHGKLFLEHIKFYDSHTPAVAKIIKVVQEQGEDVQDNHQSDAT